MTVSSVSAISGINTFRPVEPVSEITKKNDSVDFNTNDKAQDSFVPSTGNELEAKYDMACRVAAYYKHYYDQLRNQGCCLA